MKKFFQGPFLLLLAALIWGTTFVAQDLASDSVRPFTYGGLRMLLGSLVLMPFLLIKNQGHLFPRHWDRSQKRYAILSGVSCGVVLIFAATAQQFGIAMGTGAGKSAFLTAFYVVLVPLSGLLVGKKPRGIIWCCVLCAVAGMYFLCIADFSRGWEGFVSGLSISVSDLITIGCSVLFTAHILVVAHFAPRTDGLLLSCLQFFFAGITGIVCMLLFEEPTLVGIRAATGAILYAAVFSCGLGYTFQILGQQRTHPAAASFIMCLESVFAVLSESLYFWVIPTVEEWIGCALMFFGLALSSAADLIPHRKKTPSPIP